MDKQTISFTPTEINNVVEPEITLITCPWFGYCAYLDSYLSQEDHPLAIRPDDVIHLRAHSLPGQFRGPQTGLCEIINHVSLTVQPQLSVVKRGGGCWGECRQNKADENHFSLSCCLNQRKIRCESVLWEICCSCQRQTQHLSESLSVKCLSTPAMRR